MAAFYLISYTVKYVFKKQVNNARPAKSIVYMTPFIPIKFKINNDIRT